MVVAEEDIEATVSGFVSDALAWAMEKPVPALVENSMHEQDRVEACLERYSAHLEYVPVLSFGLYYIVIVAMQRENLADGLVDVLVQAEE